MFQSTRIDLIVCSLRTPLLYNSLESCTSFLNSLGDSHGEVVASEVDEVCVNQSILQTSMSQFLLCIENVLRLVVGHRPEEMSERVE